MREVRFAQYRRYEARRVNASNAMMTLLAGAGMASHLLQLTRGSKHLLPEVFPQVPYIGRFNLRSELAREILDAADVYLGAMAIPYALAIHEDFLHVCIELLVTVGACTASQAKKAGTLATKHPLIAQATGGVFNADGLGQFETIRLMRNCMIHNGGRANHELLNNLATWTSSIEAGWVKLTGNNLRQLRLGAEPSFGHDEMILALAVTKVLAREANQLLQPKLPRNQWADMLIEDLVNSDTNVLRAPDFNRRAHGPAKFHYAPLQLSDGELEKGRPPISRPVDGGFCRSGEPLLP